MFSMDGSKALHSRRSSSGRAQFLSVLNEDDDDSDVNLHNTSHNRSSDGSVFLDDVHVVAGEVGAMYGRRGVSESDRVVRSASAQSYPKSPATSPGGYDTVDMSLKSSKDIAKGFKRRTSETRDVVATFNWLDMIIGISSIIVYFVDVVTDIKLSVDYFLDSYWFYGGVTTGLIVGPSLVTCCFGLHWYAIDYRMEKAVIKKFRKKNKSLHHVTPPYIWFLRFFFTSLMIGPVVRTIEYLYYGCKSRSKKIDEKAQRRYHWWMLYEDVDNCLLRLFESFLESAPQLVWQLYITIKTKPEDSIIGTTTRAVALLSSWGSLAVSLVSYHRSLRNSREDKDKMCLSSMPFYFLWRACETGGRVLVIAMFASVFDYWVFGILLFHWALASGWLMNQRTTFYENRCLERVFNIICGYVMIFCFLNLREGHTRYRFLIFYIVFYIENFFLLSFWFRFTRDLGAWFHLWGFITVLIFFVLAIFFQLMYYACCHPTGNIPSCLPCDRYTFYESVCYDVRPDVDDAVGSPSKRYTHNEFVYHADPKMPRLVPAVGNARDADNSPDVSLEVIKEHEERSARSEESLQERRMHDRHHHHHQHANGWGREGGRRKDQIETEL